MTELALWQFVIPGLAFFGTIPFHSMEDHASLFAIVGACLVVTALVVGETAMLMRRGSKRPPGSERRGPNHGLSF
jgi:hypothetical protein